MNIMRMPSKEYIKDVKEIFYEDWKTYNHYLWMYFLDFRYNLNLSLEEKELCDIAHRMYSAWQKKKNRIKRMLDYIIMKCRKTGNVWFCTFTFDNDHIDVLHKDVKKIFSNLDWCILNEDFGKTTERRHYHAIIGGLSETELKELWKFGFTKFKRITFHTTSYEKVSKYIVKLSQHSIKKEVAKNLFYSRKLRFINR